MNGELYEAKHDIEKLKNALKTIAAGDWPRTRVAIYREDQQNSKHDKCLHGRRMWEDCDCCAADYAESVLNGKETVMANEAQLRSALRAARAQLVTLGGEALDVWGDKMQRAVLNEIDAALGEKVHDKQGS